MFVVLSDCFFVSFKKFIYGLTVIKDSGLVVYFCIFYLRKFGEMVCNTNACMACDFSFELVVV